MQSKVEYWLELCDDDLATAKWLLEGGRLLHCGYFCHQIAEKALKAVVA
ncbi:MAG: HEPN domain-containing protein, partial [Clostridium sp.]|nr:HEPN domain-containing protein [Clostridium sp.]